MSATKGLPDLFDTVGDWTVPESFTKLDIVDDFPGEEKLKSLLISAISKLPVNESTVI